jgi:hypothetical protein
MKKGPALGSTSKSGPDLFSTAKQKTGNAMSDSKSRSEFNPAPGEVVVLDDLAKKRRSSAA